MRLPADQRRQQLIDVARDVFSERGFHATSMDEVALAAGVTKPVVYQHFPSKRALYIELLQDTGGHLLRNLEQATRRATTGRERVEEGFAAYFRFVVQNRSAFRLLFGASIRNDPEFSRIVEGTIAAAVEEVSTLIDIGGSSEQRTVLANALVGMAEGVSRRAVRDPDAEDDANRLARWVAEFAWFGLRGVRADESTPAQYS
ncbi:MAG: transcriptional regulator, TetR family [Actinomycetia bacterium]|jgi:AcrR family transcriptional regulator|nr:transcriptional regulator, TetR family [Actinomycetes bacterium]